jgi:hypothetical protein
VVFKHTKNTGTIVPVQVFSSEAGFSAKGIAKLEWWEKIKTGGEV